MTKVLIGTTFLAKFVALNESMMKFKFISFAAASLAVVALGSCTRHAGEPVSRDILFGNATRVDTEGFTFFKTVYAKAVYETELAKHVRLTQASPEAKELAGQVIETYESAIPELVALATDFYVLLPDAKTLAFAVPHHFDVDSLGNFDSAAYIEHVQHEQGAILEQLGRIDRNTSKVLKGYAKEKLPAVKELFASAGGSEDHHAHH